MNDLTSEDLKIIYKKLESYKAADTIEAKDKLREFFRIITQVVHDGEVCIRDHGSFIDKFKASAPYHWFFTTVEKARLTYDQPFSVSFNEIIDYKVGEIVDSLHINFMVSVSWLILQYVLAYQNPKMTVFYGTLMDPDFRRDIFDMKFVEVKMPGDFGCHHSKVSILKYKDNSIRILISTANLYLRDWQTRTQG